VAEVFDVVVVGAGPAGEHAAGRLADGRRGVAVVERELVGGECSYWGCIPSKTLIRPGDVLPPFTDMGKYHGRVAAAAILGGQVTDIASHGIVPRVTFTDPQVCAVGREAEARAAGRDVTVVRTPTGDLPGAYTQGNGIRGTSQLVIDDTRRTIVGATFTGPGLQELLHSATVAICAEATVDRLQHAVPSFPTVSEVWLLLEAYGL
jgi:pyruvate/2-oxoglutarate dehydrogenase complex dihydrolipoamide dehydrogenase (E3) component